jgi:hypothetical protein
LPFAAGKARFRFEMTPFAPFTAWAIAHGGAPIVLVAVAVRLSCRHSGAAKAKNIPPIRSRNKPIAVVSWVSADKPLRAISHLPVRPRRTPRGEVTMTKIQSTVFAIKTVGALALVLLSASALIFAEASLPAGQRLSSYEADVSTMEAGSIFPYAMHLTVNQSALPVQNGYAAF